MSGLYVPADVDLPPGRSVTDTTVPGLVSLVHHAADLGIQLAQDICT